MNHWLDLRKCILHQMPIVSVSQNSHVPSEMCDKCECLDLKRTEISHEISHEYFKLRDAKCMKNSTTIEADHLIAQAEEKIRNLSAVMDTVTEKMKEVHQFLYVLL